MERAETEHRLVMYVGAVRQGRAVERREGSVKVCRDRPGTVKNTTMH